MQNPPSKLAAGSGERKNTGKSNPPLGNGDKIGHRQTNSKQTSSSTSQLKPTANPGKAKSKPKKAAETPVDQVPSEHQFVVPPAKDLWLKGTQHSSFCYCLIV